MPVNVGNSENIVLESNGAIRLQGTSHGTKGMLLTSNANGQAYWDWIDHAAQHPGANNSFKPITAIGASGVTIATGSPSGNAPGSVWATSSYSGTGFRYAIICMHCSFFLPTQGVGTLQARVSLQESSGSYDHADWSTCEGSGQIQSPNVNVPGGGSYGGSTISWNNEKFHAMHAFSSQTIKALDPGKSYRILGGGYVVGGSGTGVKTADGSIRALFFK